ncbi:hypothetical protein OG625_00260 [Streptomyces sp. NBC_01351]|uniref:hypothetical protein n=1 Tax=Streptomyces sp. NBC_01351 TaxID=2903833 RepID=UPI002E35CBAA|nr:hypothetical protein [Streptomyces sp. NBC_01351]
MSLLYDALPEFLGSTSAAAFVAVAAWTVKKFRARRPCPMLARPSGREERDDDPDAA